MKIISKGSLSLPSWWIGRVSKCPKCKQVVELEEGDPVRKVDSNVGNVLYVAVYRCHFCKALVYLTRST